METATEKLMGVEALAEYLGVRPSWVYTQVAEGFIPRLRVGRYLRFRLSEVLAWLEARE